MPAVRFTFARASVLYSWEAVHRFISWNHTTRDINCLTMLVTDECSLLPKVCSVHVRRSSATVQYVPLYACIVSIGSCMQSPRGQHSRQHGHGAGDC